MKHFMTAATIALTACICLLLAQGPAAAQGSAEILDLSKITQGDSKWKAYNRAATAIEDGARKAVRLDERQGDGLVLLQGSRFGNGMIELDIRGKDVFQQSFVGIAFHAVDEKSYDAIYFRPFNFKNPDPVRSNHAVQYVSHPEYTWQKLRAEKPEQYEKAVRPVPDPNGWFHVRVVIAAPKVSVYVDGSSEPSLTVDKLGTRLEGMYGLMVGNGSGGDFANLKIAPASAAKSK
jgi:hypothetical protein